MGVWLGQVPLRPWKRGAQSLGARSRYRMGQLVSCVQRTPGGQPGEGILKSFDVGTGECINTFNVPGIHPGVSECGPDGFPQTCPGGRITPPVPPTPPPIAPPIETDQVQPPPVIPPAMPPPVGPPMPAIPTPATTTLPQMGPTTVETRPTGAFPGRPFERMATTPVPAPMPPAPVPAPLMPPPCPSGPVPLRQWAEGCAAAKFA